MIFKKIAPIVPAFIFSCILFSCKQEKTNTETAPTIETVDSTKKQTVTIGTFNTSPETDTCSCLYAVDSVSFLKKEYIFAYDLALTAYMKINGEWIKFRQTEFSDSGENTLTNFNSERYKMILESGNVKEAGKEQTIQTGSIRVMDDKGNAEIIVYYGMCGCYKKSK
jgi:hypothetical protein